MRVNRRGQVTQITHGQELFWITGHTSGSRRLLDRVRNHPPLNRPSSPCQGSPRTPGRPSPACTGIVGVQRDRHLNILRPGAGPAFLGTWPDETDVVSSRLAQTRHRRIIVVHVPSGDNKFRVNRKPISGRQCPMDPSRAEPPASSPGQSPGCGPAARCRK